VVVARAVPSVSGDGAGGSGRAWSRVTPALALLCGLAVVAAVIEAAP
jgi:hypothetical protein